MNNLKMLLAAMIMMISVAGCSKDDDNNELSIVGTWQQEVDELTINPNVPGIGPQPIPYDDTATVVFNSNGTGTRTSEDGTDNFSWTLDGNRITIVFDDRTLILNLTTHTHNRLVAEQNFTMNEIVSSGLLDAETLQVLQVFPNLTARIVMTLDRLKIED
jgi:hypothetical protein